MSADQIAKLPELLRRKQVIGLLGCHKGMFYDLIGSGAFTPMSTPGGQARIPKWQVLQQLHLDASGRPKPA